MGSTFLLSPSYFPITTTTTFNRRASFPVITKLNKNIQKTLRMKKAGNIKLQPIIRCIGSEDKQTPPPPTENDKNKSLSLYTKPLFIFMICEATKAFKEFKEWSVKTGSELEEDVKQVSEVLVKKAVDLVIEFLKVYVKKAFEWFCLLVEQYLAGKKVGK